MSLDPALAGLLVCPVDRGPLAVAGETVLYNPRLRRAYPVVDGIPVLIPAEARQASDADHQRYLAVCLGWTGRAAAPGSDAEPSA